MVGKLPGPVFILQRCILRGYFPRDESDAGLFLTLVGLSEVCAYVVFNRKLALIYIHVAVFPFPLFFRCVKPAERSLALGLKVIITRLFGELTRRKWFSGAKNLSLSAAQTCAIPGFFVS